MLCPSKNVYGHWTIRQRYVNDDLKILTAPFQRLFYEVHLLKMKAGAVTGKRLNDMPVTQRYPK